MKITEFKKGDAIVRTECSKGNGDRSYMGEKLTFVGIANGCVYLDREADSFFSRMSGEVRMDLRLDWWDEGWEHWQEVDGEDFSSTQVKYNLKSEVEKAVSEENYELIAELKSILDKSLTKLG